MLTLFVTIHQNLTPSSLESSRPWPLFLTARSDAGSCDSETDCDGSGCDCRCNYCCVSACGDSATRLPALPSCGIVMPLTANEGIECHQAGHSFTDLTQIGLAQFDPTRPGPTLASLPRLDGRVTNSKCGSALTWRAGTDGTGQREPARTDRAVMGRGPGPLT